LGNNAVVGLIRLAEIRVAIAGVGNCASALVQGVEYYKNLREEAKIPGLMHVSFGGYHVRNIRFVAAFDVNKFTDVPHLGVKVLATPILDGVASHMRTPFKVYNEGEMQPVDVKDVLKEVEAEVLVNLIPVGSYEATRHYAQAALDSNCALVNCIPEFIASNSEWSGKFEEKGLPVAGDDIKSQFGATILHRNLIKLCVDRGVEVDQTYQLNLGGNTDFLNMTVENRLKTKRISKTEAVTSLVPYNVPTRIGPSDYVPFLDDRKICYIFVKGRKFGNQPFTLTAKLEVEDSPNDVIRAVKLALDRKISGPLTGISSYAFKHPPVQVPDDTAKQWVEDFIAGKRER